MVGPGTDRSASRQPRARPPPPGGWAERLRALADGAERPSPPGRSSWFRLGDVCLEVASDEGGFLDELESHYRDCVVARRQPGLAELGCQAGRLPGSSLLCLTFTGADLPDPIESAGTRFRMLKHLARYAEVPGPAAGWRMLVDGERGRLLAAGDGHRLVVDLDEAPAEFAADSVVSLAQRAQPGVLFLHAASFAVGGAGALLVGGSHTGKSTTALALAERGHAFLGDDVAAIRLQTRELVPFPKVMRLRPGAPLRSLEARLRSTRHATAVGLDGVRRTLVSMGDLLPAAVGQALPLRFAFLLDGFGAHPRVTRYRPGIADAGRLKGAVSESLPSWGLSPGRDLMRFLSVVNVLSGLECYLVELGSPEDSGAAIEAVMEETCRST